MSEAIFTSYKNGFFTFLFESGEEMIFDEVHPRALKQYDLKNDKSLIGKSFKVVFIEIESSNEDEVIYRVENLKPI